MSNKTCIHIEVLNITYYEILCCIRVFIVYFSIIKAMCGYHQTNFKICLRQTISNELPFLGTSLERLNQFPVTSSRRKAGKFDLCPSEASCGTESQLSAMGSLHEGSDECRKDSGKTKKGLRQ